MCDNRGCIESDVISCLDPGKRVTSLRDLKGRKFRLLVNCRRDPFSQPAVPLFHTHLFDYYVVPDSGKPGPYLHITAEQLQDYNESTVRNRPDFPLITQRLRDRVVRNWINTHSDRLWTIPSGRREALINKLFSSAYREFLLNNYLQYFPTRGTFEHNLLSPCSASDNVSTSSAIWSEEDKVIRMSESVSIHHEMHSAIIAMIGHISALHELTSRYRCNVSEHEDRVDFLYAMPLKDILQYDGKKSMIAYFDRVIRTLYPQIKKEDALKISIKHHLLEVLFIGIQKKWKNKHGVIPDIDSLHSPYHLARSRGGDVAVLLSIVTSNKKTNKFEIDIPGGKRELGESPLECAIRETWEEIGIDLSACNVLDGSISDRLDSSWVLCQHRELDDYSCYFALHCSLWYEIHPDFSKTTSTADTENTDIDYLVAGVSKVLKLSSIDER